MLTHSKELIIIRGHSGSGKSTLAENFVGQGFTWVDSDFFPDKYIYSSSGLMLNPDFTATDVWGWVTQQIFDLFLIHDKIVLSGVINTNGQLEPFITEALKKGFVVRIVTCEAVIMPDGCLANNAHNVPDKTVEQQKANWERFQF